MVNSGLTIAEQAEGGVIFGLSAALFGRLSIKNGVAWWKAISTSTSAWCGWRRRRGSSFTRSERRQFGRQKKRHAADRGRRDQRDLRRDRQAHPHAADHRSRSVPPVGLNTAPAAGSAATHVARRRPRRAAFATRRSPTVDDFCARTTTPFAAALVSALPKACPAANAQGSATPPSKGEHSARASDCVALSFGEGRQGLRGRAAHGYAMGVIYSTNITPDPQTGIGNYSLQDFDARCARASRRTDTGCIRPCLSLLFQDHRR